MSQVTEDKEQEWRPTNAEYHDAVEWCSASMMRQFRRSRVEFCNIYVTGTQRRPEPTEEKRLGIALHVQLLETERWDDLIAVLPRCDGRTKNGRAMRAEFAESSKGKTVITADQDECVKLMAKSVMAHPIVSVLMQQGGKREYSYRANDPSTGLPLKARLDFECLSPLILDLKTSRDSSPSAWAYDAGRYGYHNQAAHYIHVVELATGVRCRFVHVVADTTNPTLPAATYYIEEDDIDRGHVQNLETYAQMRNCYETNDWLEPQHKEILRIKLPRWS